MEKDFQRKQYELQSKHFQNAQRIQGLSVDNDDNYDDNGERWKVMLKCHNYHTDFHMACILD